MDAPRANLREPEAGYAIAGFTVKAKSLFNKVRAGGGRGKTCMLCCGGAVL